MTQHQDANGLPWSDRSAAVPIGVPLRDEWARSAMANPHHIMSRSGDSAVIRLNDAEYGSFEILDVLVRRSLRASYNPDAALTHVEPCDYYREVHRVSGLLTDFDPNHSFSAVSDHVEALLKRLAALESRESSHV